MNPVIQSLGPCPCESCPTVGTKIAAKSGHLVGCKCRSCVGRRNKRKGQAAEHRRHLLLGGEGQTIRDELFHAYSINVSTEDKAGEQIPAKFIAFISSEWVRHALAQANKKAPVGSDAYPAIYMHPHGGGDWLLVDCSGKGLR
jgi:hypothetical protein